MSKTKLEDTGGWTPVIESLCEHYDIATALVFGVVWRYCNMHHGICDAALDTIAHTARVSRSTAKRKLKILIEKGFIVDMTQSERHRPHYYQDTGKAGIHMLAYNSDDFLQHDIETGGADIDLSTPEGYQRLGKLAASAMPPVECTYCGRDIFDSPEMIGDETNHIIPASRGGSDLVDNLTTSCTRCNRMLGSREFSNLYEKVAWIRHELKIEFPVPERYKLITGSRKGDKPTNTPTGGGYKRQRHTVVQIDPNKQNKGQNEPYKGQDEPQLYIEKKERESPQMPRTAEELKAQALQAMVRGSKNTMDIRTTVEKRFHIAPNWQTKGWSEVLMFIRTRPAGETLDLFADWWYESDWRGKQGAPPTCSNIHELWPQAFKGDGESGMRRNPDGSFN